MTSIEALVRIAERYDRMILHETTPAGDTYRIADEGVLYVYSPSANGDIPFPPITSQQDTHVMEPGREKAAPAATGLRRLFNGRR